MTEPPEEQQLPYVDQPCPELYANGARVVADQNVVRIEFLVDRLDLQDPTQPRFVTPVARIAIPARLAQALREELAKMPSGQ